MKVFPPDFRPFLPLLLAAEPLFGAIEILDQAGFDAAIAGETAYTDNFAGRPDGLQDAPFVLSNGLVFGGSRPEISSATLFDNRPPEGLARSFSGFATPATLFGTHLDLRPGDTYEVEVLTTGGDSRVLAPQAGSAFDGFLGVRVSGGDSLLRVSLTATAAGGNFGFESVTVDATTLPAYQVEVIATYDTTTTLRGASEAGHLVGDQVVAGQNRAFVATEADGLVLLPLPPGYNSSIAYGVNSDGVVVGTASDQGLAYDFGEPAIWTPDGSGGYTVAIPEQFVTLPGIRGPLAVNGGQIVAINDAGTMVGWSRLSGFGGGPATRFFASGPPQNLGEIGFSATPAALNNLDVVAGGGKRLDLGTGTVTDIGLPAPLEPGGIDFIFSRIFALNDSNEAVVAADLASVPTENFLTYLHDDTRGFTRLNPASVPSRFVGFYDNNNRGDVSASGGVLFAAEGVLAPGFDGLLVPADRDWDVNLGFIDDARRVATTARRLVPDENALVLLEPTAGPDLDVRDDAGRFLATGGTFDFGGVATGEQLELPVVLENTGTLDLAGLSASLGGPHAADFTILTPPPATLAPGAGASLLIRFSPQSTGARHATLSIPGNDPDESPFVLHLSGFSGTPGEVVDFLISEAGLDGPDAGPLAAPHRDGLPNLLKLAFNLDLTGPDRRRLTPGGTAGLPTHELDTSGPGTVWRTTFLRRKGSGLAYTPQGGENPASFSELGGSTTVTDLNGRWERVVIENPVDLSAQPRFFGRVRVVAP